MTAGIAGGQMPGLCDGHINVPEELSQRFQVDVPLLFGLPAMDLGIGKRWALAWSHRAFQWHLATTHPVTAELANVVRQICGDRDCAILTCV